MVSGTTLYASAAAAPFHGLSLPASAEPDEIESQDVMGEDQERPGWLEPGLVPREESAAKDAPDPGGDSMSSQSGDRGGSDASALKNGPDGPQKPLDHRAPTHPVTIRLCPPKSENSLFALDDRACANVLALRR